MRPNRVGLGVSLGFCALFLVAAAHFPARAQNQPPVPPSGNASQPFDLKSYRDELARVQGLSKDKNQIHALRMSLPETWTVKRGDREFSVSTQEISSTLREMEVTPSRTKNLAERLDARVRTMRQEATELEHVSPGTDTAAADAKLKSILNRSEFQASTGPSPVEILRARVFRWLAEHVIRLLNRLHIPEKTGNFLGWGFIFAALVILFYFVYRWLSKSTAAPEFTAETPLITSDARQWLHDALAAAERGDYREAIHCAYWASIARLEDTRLLSRDRARTPRESLCLLEQYPRELGFLRAITGNFELIWYGYRPASVADWTGARDQLEKMGCL